MHLQEFKPPAGFPFHTLKGGLQGRIAITGQAGWLGAVQLPLASLNSLKGVTASHGLTHGSHTLLQSSSARQNVIPFCLAGMYLLDREIPLSRSTCYDPI